MKKRILILCSVGFFSLSYGQEATATHTLPQTVLATPSLKAQAEKIQQKELQLSQATTASRGQYAQLKEELTALNSEYKVLLMNQIQLVTDEAVRKELQAELYYVEQQLAGTNLR